MALPSLNFLRQYIRALRHPGTPRRAAYPLILALAYIVMPLDGIPDWIPGLGQLDDLTVLSGLAWMSWRMIPKSIRQKSDPEPPRGSVNSPD
jgi:uncharacterized membrane protein YkvA (DUF1232 family)